MPDLFKNIVQHSSAGLVVLDLKLHILYLNPASEVLLNRSGKVSVGHLFPFPVPANKTTEITIPHDGDDYTVAEMHVSEIEWNGKPAYLVCLNDVTGLERIERLKAEILERQRIDRLKDEFISTVSHELRTPLTIVKGAIDNLKDGVVGPLSEKQTRIVDIAHNNANRLVRIINDLLDLSRLESGKISPHKSQIPTLPLLQEVIQNFHLRTEDKKIELKLETYTEHIPDLYADPDMVMQVFNNLMDNALRFSKKSITLKVREPSPAEESLKNLEQEAGYLHPSSPLNPKAETPSYLEFEIIDDGPGIPTAHLGDLFNKFVQLNRPMGGSGYKGTGLGLAICKEIVKKHGGTIWAESLENIKTSFHFLLPQFNSQTQFWDVLNSQITEAKNKKNPLVLAALSITNYDALAKQLTPSKLVQTVQVLEEQIKNNLYRKTDLVFQYNQDLFFILLPHTNQKQVELILKRLGNNAEISMAPTSLDQTLPETNITYALYPSEAVSAQELVDLVLNKRQKK